MALSISNKDLRLINMGPIIRKATIDDVSAVADIYNKIHAQEAAGLDTQVKNFRPFNMYPKLGYSLAGISDTEFQNLPDTVKLAMFEKKL